MASIQQAFDNILKRYQEEYFRHLEYIDPRNVSKASNKDLLNEHNQTVNFYNAVHSVYDDAIVWFELSIGRSEGAQKSDTNRIDGVILIPSKRILLIVEAKGLRDGTKKSKTAALLEDLQRTLGTDRNGNDGVIQQYKMGIAKPKEIYAITLADVWNGTEEKNNTACSWDNIACKNRSLGERNGAFKELVNQDGLYHKWWYSSQHEFGFFLLAMIRELSDSEVATYTFTKSH